MLLGRHIWEVLCVSIQYGAVSTALRRRKPVQTRCCRKFKSDRCQLAHRLESLSAWTGLVFQAKLPGLSQVVRQVGERSITRECNTVEPTAAVGATTGTTPPPFCMTWGCRRVHPWFAPDFTECLISIDTMNPVAPDQSPSLVFGMVGRNSRGGETGMSWYLTLASIHRAILGAPISILFSSIF